MKTEQTPDKIRKIYLFRCEACGMRGSSGFPNLDLSLDGFALSHDRFALRCTAGRASISVEERTLIEPVGSNPIVRVDSPPTLCGELRAHP